MQKIFSILFLSLILSCRGSLSDASEAQRGEPVAQSNQTSSQAQPETGAMPTTPECTGGSILSELQEIPVYPVTDVQKNDLLWLERLDFSIPRDPGYKPYSDYSVFQMLVNKTGKEGVSLVTQACLDKYTSQAHMRLIFNVRRGINLASHKITDTLYAIVPNFNQDLCTKAQFSWKWPRPGIPFYVAGPRLVVSEDNHHLVTDTDDMCIPDAKGNPVACGSFPGNMCVQAADDRTYLFVPIAVMPVNEYPSISMNCKIRNNDKVEYICGRGGNVINEIKIDAAIDSGDLYIAGWAKKAEEGWEFAQLFLGMLYEKGLGVEQSDEEAYYWYRLADRGGATPNVEDQILAAQRRLSVRQLADVERKVSEWQPAPIRPPQQTLGLISETPPQNGTVITPSKTSSDPQPAQDPELSFIFSKAEKGDADAEYLLGRFYFEGERLPKDAAAAFKWFLQSAQRDNPLAQVQLAKMLLSGTGVPRDPESGVSWLKKAADGGNAAAQSDLGSRYLMGVDGLPQDPNEALRWIKKAAEQGEPSVQKMLGGLYLGWPGIQQNWEDSYFWMALGQKRDGKPYQSSPDPKDHLTPKQIAQLNARIAKWKPSVSGKNAKHLHAKRRLH